MLSSDVEARLRSEVSELKAVYGAAGFANLRQGNELRTPPQTPAAYVITLREVPQKDLYDVGNGVLQNVVYHIAVITVVRVANNNLGDETNTQMDLVREEIKAALYGWTPAGFEQQFKRGPSALFDFAGGAHWHQDEFIIDRYEEPTSD
ncbi:phage tail terminator protein [Zhongshania aliphaticivorans]|uniref:phage tail terminator protein n=1 Tax=Zhongshania aliphaticivorans TaxID=1470434 RepID=UPI0012E4E63D|nr:hypothetical protein [Zhongshania aliphaticivorans]CAA0103571.1 Uncharacterised protein [Zhongshania aliphaticivorans]